MPDSADQALARYFQLDAADLAALNNKIGSGASLGDLIAGTDPVGSAYDQYLTDQAIAAGESTLPRVSIVSSAIAAGVNQVLNLSYFTARKTELIGNVRNLSGATAAGATPTLCRIGIYSVAANGDIALLAAIANDTTLWAATFTPYTRALTAAFQKIAGTRYAWGQLCVTGAAAPTFPGSVNGLVPNTAPRLSATLAAQADLPASVANASLTYPTNGSLLYGELLP